jgi:tetratricopeptide (TPR) repeat protein
VEAEEILMITLQLCKKIQKVDFGIVHIAMNNLVHILSLKGEAKSALEWSICRAERAGRSVGKDHPTTMNARRRVAKCLIATSRVEEGEELLHSILRTMIRVLGERHEETVYCMLSYGRTLNEQGKHSEAEAWLKKSFRSLLASFGPEHRHTLYSCQSLLWCLEDQGRFDEALQVCERYLQELRTREGITDRHRYVIKVHDWMDRISKRIEKQLRVLDIFAAEEQ